MMNSDVIVIFITAVLCPVGNAWYRSIGSWPGCIFVRYPNHLNCLLLIPRGRGSIPRLTQIAELLILLQRVSQATLQKNLISTIPFTMLQSITQDLFLFTTSIINDSITSGHITTAFKTARVIYMPKKHTQNTLENNKYLHYNFSFSLKIVKHAEYN